MENEYSSRNVEASGGRAQLKLPSVLYVVFLILMLVGIYPFGIRDAATLSHVAEGGGDSAKQIPLIILTVGIALTTLRTKGFSGAFSIPWPIVLTLAWFFISISWSMVPDVSFRRCMLTMLVCFSVFAFAEDLGASRMLQILTSVLSVLLLVNFVSVFVVPQAVHLPGEMASDLVGNWRGLHFHKNIAGPIAGLSAILFLVRAMRVPTLKQWLLFIICVCFVYFTRSKTTIWIDAILLPLTAVAELCSRKPERFKIFIRTIVFAMFILFLGLIIEARNITDIISDPDSLTGRGAIWGIASSYAAKHPITGSGYAAFWGMGNASPVLSATAGTWLDAVSHSHNGFLEILVTTGFPGLILASFSAVAWPIWRLMRQPPKEFAPLFGILFFSLLLNLSETRLFQGSREEWIIHLIAIAVIWQTSKQTQKVTSGINQMKQIQFTNHATRFSRSS